jgi:Asp-tRNA(Asn)/Glu-tRNA(Gln) amidotransferase A subunit family amidase
MSTVEALLKEFRSGTRKVADYVEEIIENAQSNADLGVVISLDEENLKSSARVADQNIEAGKAEQLEGLPLIIKDNIDTSMLITTGGTGAFNDAAKENAPPLQRLLQKGAIAGAKANLHELAYGITSNNSCHGAVRNPWDKTKIAGGSSGGTAAAIAAGIFIAGLGSDTGGSVRIPAALCGIMGFRPSTNRYPAGGVVPLSSTRDTIGPMGTSVDDMVLLDGVMANDNSRLADLGASDIRIGVPRAVLWDGLEKGVEGCCENVITTLAKAGVTIVEMDPEDIWEDDAAASLPIVLYESMKELALYAESRGVAFSEVIDGVASPDVKAILESQLGEEAVTESVYRAAMETHRPNMQRKWQAYFDEHNLSAALFPTTALTAPLVGQDETVSLNGEDVSTFDVFLRNTDHGSVIGAPGISMPAGLAGNMPVGFELDGLPGHDKKLLAVARKIEEIVRPMDLLSR